MSFSGVVQWWDEWQLRVLVLGSLLVQYSLFFSSASRKFHIPGWFRFFIWLSYLGSDALAIYALATLFNRQKQPSPSTSSTASAHGSSGSHGLEVMWAPILLIHLAGQDPITAYNIEDNELWTRHIITVVSQVTVAVYVFCKSWSGEKRLLQAAILLFVAGILKGSEKPWALYRASIHNLVSSSSNSHSRLLWIFYTDISHITARSVRLEKIIAGRVARIFGRVPFMAKIAKRVESTLENEQGEGEDDQEQGGSRRDLTLQAYVRECRATMVGGTSQESAHNKKSQEEALEKALPDLPLEPRELFIDLALPYSRRLRILKSLMPLDGTCVDRVLQAGLSNSFDLLYTKEKVFQTYYGKIVRTGIMIFNFAAVGLFSRSNKHGYNKNDVIATYILFGGTAALESLAFLMGAILDNSDVPRTRRILENPRGQRRRLLDRLQEALGEQMRRLLVDERTAMAGEEAPGAVSRREEAPGAVSRRENGSRAQRSKTCIESCGSSIVRQVLQGVRRGLFKQPRELELDDWFRKPRWSGMVAQYNLLGFFSRNTSPNVLMKATRLFGCKDYLDRHCYVEYYPSSRRITEVILEHVKDGWKTHIVDVPTYKGFNNRRGQLTLQQDGRLRWSIQKPFDESILLWHIATDLCFHCEKESRCREKESRCREMSNYMIYLLFVQPEMLLAGTRQNLFTAACGELDVIFKDGKPQLDGGELAKKVAEKASEDAENEQDAAGTFIRDAWKLYNALQTLGDEKMWDVIEGVWVEMLCYSASRCRGHLHAKSLGTGGEYLSYVWLLLSHMGMETLADRFQQPEEPPEKAVAASASTSQSQVGAPEQEISPVWL